MEEMGTGYTSDVGSEGSQERSATAQVVEKGKEKASEFSGNLRSKVFEKVDQQKDQLCSSLDRLADSIEEAGKDMDAPEAKVASRAAGFLRSAEGLIKDRSSDEIFNRAVSELRNRPGALIAGAFVLGFIGTRFMKS